MHINKTYKFHWIPRHDLDIDGWRVAWLWWEVWKSGVTAKDGPYTIVAYPSKKLAFVFDMRPNNVAWLQKVHDQSKHHLREMRGCIGEVWIDRTGAWNSNYTHIEIGYLPINTCLKALGYPGLKSS